MVSELQSSSKLFDLSWRCPVSAKVLALVAVAAQMFLVARAAQAGSVPTPVPEPTTIALLGAGAAVAAVGAWWKTRK